MQLAICALVGGRHLLNPLTIKDSLAALRAEMWILLRNILLACALGVQNDLGDQSLSMPFCLHVLWFTSCTFHLVFHTPSVKTSHIGNGASPWDRFGELTTSADMDTPRHAISAYCVEPLSLLVVEEESFKLFSSTLPDMRAALSGSTTSQLAQST